MTDSATLEIFTSAFEQAWSNLQWWAGVSFGLMAVSGLAARKLNRTIAVSLTVIYLLFSLFTLVNVQSMINVAFGAVQDLRAFQESGSISHAGANVLKAAGYSFLNGILGFACFATTSFGAIAYSVVRNSQAQVHG
jgi:hypothetical protein